LAQEAAMGHEAIVILTGAGVSAESGLSTFRDKDGLWLQVDLEEVASIRGYRRNPQKVLDFYNARRRGLAGVDANPAHRALADLQAGLAARGGRVTLVTQNVDDLHERGGANDVVHMHGELLKQRCMACEDIAPCSDDIEIATVCRRCGAAGAVRPHIVWFGEMPLELERIYAALRSADLFVAIGTSGAVYPAAGFVDDARRAGVATLELNLAPSDTADLFDEGRYGPASVIVPHWVQEVLRMR
jgi:NAD-dependent deacetylase